MASPLSSANADAPRPPRSGFVRIMGNVGHLLGGKAGAGLISLVYLVMVTRGLGSDGYGRLVLLNGIVIFVGSLVAFSGFHGLVRYGALALAERDIARFALIARFMAVVEIVFGVIAALVSLAAIHVLMPRWGWPPAYGWAALCYSLAVAGTVRATPQGLLQVAGRFDLIGLHQLVSPVVRLVGATVAWLNGGGLLLFTLAWAASGVLEGVAMWLLALPQWRRIAPGQPVLGPWRPAAGSAPGLIPFIVTTNFDITIRELAPNLAPLTIGWVLGPAAAGIYALTQRASAVLAQPAQALGQASYAVLAELVAARHYDALARAVWKSVTMAAIVGIPILILFACWGDGLLALLGGGSFRGGATLLLLVGAGRLALLGAAPLASALTALGYPSRSMTISLVANLLLYPLLPVLLWWLAVDGAGWHALLQGILAFVALMLSFAAIMRSRAAAP